MENRKTYHLELTTVELVAIINALDSTTHVAEDETFRDLILELELILNKNTPKNV